MYNECITSKTIGLHARKNTTLRVEHLKSIKGR